MRAICARTRLQAGSYLGQGRATLGLAALALLLTTAAPLRAQDEAPETQDNAPVAAVVAPESPASPEVPASAPSPTVAVVATTPAPAAPEWIDRGEVVAIGGGAYLRENERASKVVAIGGSVEIRGRVDGEVVAIGGHVTLDGRADKVVAIFGGVTLGPKASVSGDLVSVGGRVENPHHVSVGNQVAVAPFLPRIGPMLHWGGDVVTHTRVLSPGLLWPWYIFGGGVLLSLFLAAVFGRGVNACVDALEERPGTTLTTAIVLLPAVPALTLVLILTGVGVLLLPLLAMVLVGGMIFGKTAVIVFLGRSLVRPFGGELIGHAWLMVPIGAVVLAVLYCVPMLGLLVWTLVTWIGLGMVVAAILGNRRRESAARAAAKAAPVPPLAARPGPAGVTPIPVAAAAVPMPETAVPAAAAEAPGAAAAAPESAGAAVPPVMPMPETVAPRLVAAVPPVLVDATLPRAEFGVRLAALLIDIVLVAVATAVTVVLAVLPFPLVFGGYMFALWLWRGTTVGGIVFNLKVVRLDGRPIDAATAMVRTLVAFLSVCAAGLGFLWCLWDDERQTWHDKVAGTVVVRVPKATPLV